MVTTAVSPFPARELRLDRTSDTASSMSSSVILERVGEVDVVDGALVQQPQASLSTSGKAGFDDAGLEKTAQVFPADTPTGEEVDWTRASILSRHPVQAVLPMLAGYCPSAPLFSPSTG